MTGSDPVPRRVLLVGALLAALAALAVYAPTFLRGGHGFVNYDDPLLLEQNPAITQGLSEGLPHLLSPFAKPRVMNAWLPLYYGSLGIDHALFDGAAWGFHLHSALLHALGAALVVVLASRLGLGAIGSAVAGLLFALHPAATENVAWVAGRKDVLAFAWMAAAALAYLEGVRGGRARWHVAGCVCLAVSLTAKGSTLVLPGLLALHALLLRRDDAPHARRLLPVVPYAAVAVAMTAVHYLVAIDEQTVRGGGAAAGRILLADLDVVSRYALLLFAPFRQSVEHGVDAAALDAPRLVLGGLILLAAAGFAFVNRRRPGRLAFLLAIPVALVPFNNLFPRTSVLFAERYAHVALLPVVLGAGVLAAAEGPRRLAALAAVGAAALLTTLRLPVWRDSVSLWEDAAEKAPESAFVRLQLADAWGTLGRTSPERADECRQRAEQAWRDARSLARDDLSKMRAESGLATQLLTTAPPSGQTEERVRESVALADAALAKLEGIDAPGARTVQRVLLLSNRATARETLGDRDGALADWRAAAQADPTNATTLNGLARAQIAAGLGQQARETLELSARAAPADAAAARERSRLRLTLGEIAAAKAELERALALRPRDYDLLMDAARLDASLLRPIDAERLFRRALEVRPGDEAARVGTAGALLDQARAQAARDDLGAARTAALSAVDIAPESPAPQEVLGVVARRAGDLEEATLRLRRAHEIDRADARVREALASVLVERALPLLENDAESVAARLLLEDAVAVGAPAISTRRARIERGVCGWPPRPSEDDALAVVSRRQALLGLAGLAAGRPADAARDLDVAVRGAERDPAMRRVALRLLVRARFLAGNPDEALAAAEALAKIPPSLPSSSSADAATPPEISAAWFPSIEWASASVEAGIAARGRGDKARAQTCFDAAQTLLDGAVALGCPPAERRLRRGEILFAGERFLEATREFDAAIEADPRCVDAYLDRAAVWRTHFLLEEDRSFLGEAEKDLRRALAAGPGDARAMAALGEILVLATRPSEAWPWLQRALLADPSQAAARRILVELTVRAARTHLEKKEVAEARAAAERALRLDAPGPEAMLLRADVHRAEGDLPGALALAEKAVAAYPDRVDARAALARHHYDAGHGFLLLSRREDAAREFLAALAVQQDQFDASAAHERLQGIARSFLDDAVRLRADGKRDEATARIRASLRADASAEGWFALGLVLYESEDFDGAVAAYASCSAISPDWVPPRLNRAAALLRAGRWDEAEAEYRALLARTDLDEKDRARVTRQIEWIAGQRREMEGGKTPKDPERSEPPPPPEGR